MLTIPHLQMPGLEQAILPIRRITQSLDELARLIELPSASSLFDPQLSAFPSSTVEFEPPYQGIGPQEGGLLIDAAFRDGETIFDQANENVCCRKLFSKIEQEFLKLDIEIKNVAIDVSLTSQAISKIDQTLSEVYDGIAALQVGQIGLAQLLSKLLPEQPDSAVDELLDDFADAVSTSGDRKAHAAWWLRFIKKLLTRPTVEETRHRKATEREDAALGEFAKVQTIDEDEYSTSSDGERKVYDELVQESIDSLIELYRHASEQAKEYPSDRVITDSESRILYYLDEAVEYQGRLQRSRQSGQRTPSDFPSDSGSFKQETASLRQPASLQVTSNSESATSRIPLVRVELEVKSDAPVRARRIYSDPEVHVDFSCGLGLVSGFTAI